MSTTTAKPFSKKELRKMYGISGNTLRNWITRSGLLKTKNFKQYKEMRILTTQMVIDIFEHFGTPEKEVN
jgi:uncharacterized protein YjcR